MAAFDAAEGSFGELELSFPNARALPEVVAAVGRVDPSLLFPTVISSEQIRRMASVQLPPDVMEQFRKAASVQLPPEVMEQFRKIAQVQLPPDVMKAMRDLANAGTRFPQEPPEAAGAEAESGSDHDDDKQPDSETREATDQQRGATADDADTREPRPPDDSDEAGSEDPDF